jgi:hypothetical protein
MSYFLGIAFILILVFLINNFLKKKRFKKIKDTLYKNWGTQKKASYYNFFVIGKYFENNAHKKESYHVISEKSRIDLDIDEIFKFIDRTSSRIGQQYLYFKLRTIGSVDRLLKFDTLTTLFQNDKDASISCQLELSKLNQTSSYYLEELINGGQVRKPKNLWFVKLLTVASVTSITLTFFFPIMIIFLVPLFAVNSVFHYKNKSNVNYYLQGIRELSKSLKVTKKLSKQPIIIAHFKDFSFIKKIESLMFQSEFIAFEKNINNEWLFPIWILIELIKIVFNVEYLVFYNLLDALTKEKNSIEGLFLFIGEIDAAIATAS